MVYNDEGFASLDAIEQMAKSYNEAMKEKGFVFVNLDEVGKNILAKEVMEILFKLRSSYRYMKNFLSSSSIASLTEQHIEKMRSLFSIEDNTGYIITCNNTKCFLNSISLEQMLNTKLLLLSQKCDYGEELISLIIERNELISHSLMIENAMYTNKNSYR